MASSTFSLCYCVFFTSPRTRTQELGLETSALSSKSSKSAARIGFKLEIKKENPLSFWRNCDNLPVCFAATKSLTHNGSKRGRYIVCQRYHGLLTTLIKQLCGPISRNLFGFSTVSTVTTVLQGYWVEPDIEDGCGYIEAIVDRIF